MDKYSTLAYIPKVIRVEAPDEKSGIKELEEQIREMKEAFAGAYKEKRIAEKTLELFCNCLLYTSPSPRDRTRSRMPSSA